MRDEEVEAEAVLVAHNDVVAGAVVDVGTVYVMMTAADVVVVALIGIDEIDVVVHVGTDETVEIDADSEVDVQTKLEDGNEREAEIDFEVAGKSLMPAAAISQNPGSPMARSESGGGEQPSGLESLESSEPDSSDSVPSGWEPSGFGFC